MKSLILAVMGIGAVAAAQASGLNIFGTGFSPSSPIERSLDEAFQTMPMGVSLKENFTDEYSALLGELADAAMARESQEQLETRAFNWSNNFFRQIGPSVAQASGEKLTHLRIATLTMLREVGRESPMLCAQVVQNEIPSAQVQLGGDSLRAILAYSAAFIEAAADGEGTIFKRDFDSLDDKFLADMKVQAIGYGATEQGFDFVLGRSTNPPSDKDLCNSAIGVLIGADALRDDRSDDFSALVLSR